MNLTAEEIARRKPVWIAMSDLWLDNDVDEEWAKQLAESAERDLQSQAHSFNASFPAGPEQTNFRRFRVVGGEFGSKFPVCGTQTYQQVPRSNGSSVFYVARPGKTEYTPTQFGTVLFPC